MANDAFNTSADSIPFNATERDAALTLLRYELRKGSTVEEAAKKYDVSLSFAQKATKPRRRRQRTVTPQLREMAVRLERVEDALCSLEQRMLTFDATLYELIDLAAKALPESATAPSSEVEQS